MEVMRLPAAPCASAITECLRLAKRGKAPSLKQGRTAVRSAASSERPPAGTMDTATHMLRTGRRGPLFEVQMAFRDLRASAERLDLAWSLAWHDVVSRYRGSILGPFWITLSMGVMVLGIGVLWGGLFRVPVHEFIPLVAVGIVFFGVVTSTINEGCDTFVAAA